VTSAPTPGPGDSACPHIERHEGVCTACGHCLHEVILNGACFLCGTTDLDPIAMSPKKPPLIAPDQLVRKKP
jgi:hypothetical protein